MFSGVLVECFPYWNVPRVTTYKRYVTAITKHFREISAVLISFVPSVIKLTFEYSVDFSFIPAVFNTFESLYRNKSKEQNAAF